MKKHRTSVILDQILQNLDGRNSNEENAANNERDGLTATRLLPDEGADTVFRPAGMMKDNLNADSTFSPETLLVGEVIMIAIIVAAIQSSLIPTFHVDLTSIEHKESTAALTCVSFTPCSVPKITYPSLTFIDKRRNFHITFSMVPIFGEMVIYAMKKNLLDDSITDAQLSTVAIVDGDSQEARRNGNKKKMIQTLYMNPNDFISEYSSLEEKNNEEKEINKNSNQLNHDFNLESATGNGIDKRDSKVNKNRVSCECSKIQIGKYVTKFHDLILRIEKTLLDPLLFENGQSSLSISIISTAVSYSIFTYLKANELCALGTTCKNLNSDYLNERTWRDLVIRDFPYDCLAVKNKELKIMKEHEYRTLLNRDFDYVEKKRNLADNNNKNNTSINNCSKYTEYRNRKVIQLKSEVRMSKLEKERDMARMRQYADSRMTYAPSFFLGPPLSYQPNNSNSNNTLLPPAHPFLPFQSDATSSFFSLPHLGLGPRTPGHFGARNDRPRHQMFPHRFSDHHSILPSFAFNNND